jgi:hypothetical protein
MKQKGEVIFRRSVDLTTEQLKEQELRLTELLMLAALKQKEV